MTTKKLVIPYYPHPKQQKFHQTRNRFRAIITGVGFGKSSAGVNELIKRCIIKPGGVRLLIGPTYPMVKNTTLREFFKFCPKELIKQHNKSEKTIILNTEPLSEIIYLSGDNERDIDRLRGLTVRDAYGDELSLCPYYIFEIVIARLRDPGGDCGFWITATPKGRNWLYYLFSQHVHPRSREPLVNPEDYVLLGGSTFDNPHTPKTYKESLLNSYSGTFAKQELYGDFVGFEGLVYNNFILDKHTFTGDKVFKHYFAGVDFGFTNPTAVIIFGVADGKYYAVDEYYQSGVGTSEFLGVMQAFHLKYRLEAVYADKSSPERIQDLNAVGIPVYKSGGGVLEGIRDVSNLIGQDCFFVHQRCVNFLMELCSYRYPEAREDRPVHENPVAVCDHLCDAARYAIVGWFSRGDIGLIGDASTIM